ncbi:MAG: hypothetical protein JSR23_06310 [Proteobacteria bacterium]|nr:hypothetical protein [Pseudomonadota bacterium]
MNKDLIATALSLSFALLLPAPAGAQQAAGATPTPATTRTAISTATAPALALQIEHHITTLSADGITRTLHYTEHMLRHGDQVWLARVLPPHAREAAEHADGGKAHRHMDIAAAARWVQRNADGRLQLRLVNAHERLLVDVPQAEWGQVGFDGQWAAAQHLLDPAQIARMKPLARAAPAGARWYQGGSANQPVQVLWDNLGQFPQRIESRNAQGSQHSVTSVKRQALPGTLPWTQLTGYSHKEYADLLD